MNKQEIIQGVILNNDLTLTFVDVCHQCQLSEEMLEDWIGHGLLGDDIRKTMQSAQFTRDMLTRIRAANRLYRELEVNIQGVILVLDLLDQITALQDELMILKR